jgi:peptide/nickel transport system permease protein
MPDSSATELTHARGPWRQAWSQYRRRPLGVGALLLLAAFVLLGALASRLSPYAPDQSEIPLIGNPQPPLSAHHLLGTDVLGHDFLSQLLAAIHETTVSALVCAAASALIGTIVGALAGYYGGWFDAFVTWLTTVVVAVPALAILLVVAIWSRFPVTPLGYAVWLTAILWTGVARVVRGAVLSLRNREYVAAARALGASDLRVLGRHLIPNTVGSIIVAATSLVGQSIVIVATVSYLGYAGGQWAKPTLGSLLADAARGTGVTPGRTYALGAPWWLYVFPAILLVVMLVCVNFVGDTLDDALDPRAARA